MLQTSNLKDPWCNLTKKVRPQEKIFKQKTSKI